MTNILHGEKLKEDAGAVPGVAGMLGFVCPVCAFGKRTSIYEHSATCVAAYPASRKSCICYTYEDDQGKHSKSMREP